MPTSEAPGEPFQQTLSPFEVDKIRRASPAGTFIIGFGHYNSGRSPVDVGIDTRGLTTASRRLGHALCLILLLEAVHAIYLNPFYHRFIRLRCVRV
jgi:hypothetical protein